MHLFHKSRLLSCLTVISLLQVLGLLEPQVARVELEQLVSLEALEVLVEQEAPEVRSDLVTLHGFLSLNGKEKC